MSLSRHGKEEWALESECNSYSPLTQEYEFLKKYFEVIPFESLSTIAAGPAESLATNRSDVDTEDCEGRVQLFILMQVVWHF